MPKTILSDDRQYRYNEAIKCMDLIMNPEHIGNEHIGRNGMNNVIRHLSGAGISMGVFLVEYFAPEKEPVKTANDSFKCACNRTFGSSQALSGHRRTCKK